MGKPHIEFKEFHTRGSGIFFNIEEVIFSDRSDYQDILLFRNSFWGKVFILDGLVMGTERDEFFYHESLVHPPMLLSRDIDRVLIVGGGDGGTLREVLKYDVKSITVAEIDHKVLKMAYEHLNMEEYFENEKVVVRVEDGFKVVNEGETYDVIIVDSTDPVGPAEVLFGEDFIKSLSRAARFVVNMQMGNPLFYSRQIKETYSIAREYFEHVKIYASFTPTYPGGFWTYLLAGRGDLKPQRNIPRGNKFLLSQNILKALFSFEEFVKQFCEIK